MKSIIGLSSLPVRFHILTDPRTRIVLDQLKTDERITKARIPISFVIVDVTTSQIKKWIEDTDVDKEPANEILNHHSGLFGASKVETTLS